MPAGIEQRRTGLNQEVQRSVMQSSTRLVLPMVIGTDAELQTLLAQ